MANLGRYQLRRRLGRGGMAEVFLARRKGPGGIEKQLVVKRIRRELARNSRFLDLFVREAKLSMSMAHKNIVPVFDFGRVGDELFLAMEYIDGCDLGDALARARKQEQLIDPLAAVFIGMEACQALDYAHSLRNSAGDQLSVVHRDVTPRNVLLSRAGEVKLADFGVATTETDLGQAGKVRGTPAYMAPEQARGEAVDSRADVFSLGLVLWEMLAGNRAYDGEDSAEVLSLARQGKVPRLPDHLDKTLRDIVVRATSPDREERYESARDLQLALDEYLLGARAQQNKKPPAHILADWVQALLPEGTGEEDAAQPDAPAGSVVTFLDDGPDRVAEALTVGGGGTTMRSVAETIAEDESGDHSDPGASASHSGVPAARPMFAIVAAATVPLLIGTAVVVYLVAGGDDAPQPPVKVPPDAAVVGDASNGNDAGGSSAEALIDAATRTATPIARPTFDAGAPKRNGKRRKPTTAIKKPTTPPDARIAAQPGTVKVSSTPWASVRVRGRAESCRDTPCTLKLPPGRHVLLLRNPVANLAKKIPIVVISGETVVVRETLTRGP